MRPVLACLLLAATVAAADPPAVRELVDHLKDLESQIALIERESASPVERTALWAGAARGMVEAADPHGSYLSADEVAIYGLGSEPLTIGCGFDWRQQADGSVVVTRVVPGSPAAAANLHPGAGLLAINGLDPAAASRRQVAEALARSGDTVALRIRFGDGATGEATLKRVELNDDGISRIAQPAPGIALVRIGRFMPAPAGAEATATASGLRRVLGCVEGLQAVILDLRGCAGGNLAAAVEIAAGWIPPGAAVAEQIGRDPARARVWSADVARLPDVPVVVLVDGGSASAAEVLARALRHYRHAPVVGAPTFGKGSVQQLFLLPHGDAISLTVARLKDPAGAWVDQPLQPDVAVAQDMTVTWRRWYGETRYPMAYDGTPIQPSGPVPEPDPQLDRALDAVRTLLAGR